MGSVCEWGFFYIRRVVDVFRIIESLLKERQNSSVLVSLSAITHVQNSTKT